MMNRYQDPGTIDPEDDHEASYNAYIDELERERQARIDDELASMFTATERETGAQVMLKAADDLLTQVAAALAKDRIPMFGGIQFDEVDAHRAGSRDPVDIVAFYDRGKD